MTPGAGWEERTRTWAHAQRRVLRQYPGVAAWLMDNGPAGPQAYRLLEVLAAAVADAGLDDQDTARGTTLVMSWTFSRISIEDNADARRRTQPVARSHAFLEGLERIDQATHPTAARIGGVLFTLDMQEVFETGLDRILAGMRSL